MKTFLIFLLPLVIFFSADASTHFFSAAHYYTSAVFTLASLYAIALWITVLSSKKPRYLN